MIAYRLHEPVDCQFRMTLPQQSGNVYLDLRGLAPPEPMERVLDALSHLPAGGRVCMLIDREPRPLYRILDNNGYLYSTMERTDFLYEILIWERP